MVEGPVGGGEPSGTAELVAVDEVTWSLHPDIGSINAVGWSQVDQAEVDLEFRVANEE